MDVSPKLMVTTLVLGGFSLQVLKLMEKSKWKIIDSITNLKGLLINILLSAGVRLQIMEGNGKMRIVLSYLLIFENYISNG